MVIMNYFYIWIIVMNYLMHLLNIIITFGSQKLIVSVKVKRPDVQKPAATVTSLSRGAQPSNGFRHFLYYETQKTKTNSKDKTNLTRTTPPYYCGIIDMMISPLAIF